MDMRIQGLASGIAIVAISLSAAVFGDAHAQSAGADAEIAALKQQLRLMEQKLDKLQKQTAANTAAAASANAKASAKVSVASANAAYPVKGPVAPSDVVVKMPNNRPTICTADDQNCIAITSRVHFDGGGYDYHPNTPATVPQRLDDGVNLRRARIGVLGKFGGDWNYALIYDFGGSSDGFASTASFGAAPPAGGTAIALSSGRRAVRCRERLSELHRHQALWRHACHRRRHHGSAYYARRGVKLERYPVHGARRARRCLAF